MGEWQGCLEVAVEEDLRHSRCKGVQHSLRSHKSFVFSRHTAPVPYSVLETSYRAIVSVQAWGGQSESRHTSLCRISAP